MLFLENVAVVNKQVWCLSTDKSRIEKETIIIYPKWQDSLQKEEMQQLTDAPEDRYPFKSYINHLLTSYLIIKQTNF